MRGPELNGTNIIGLDVSLAIRLGSRNRSGSNSSASSPQRSGLRCMSIGMYMIGVEPGMYNGSVGIGIKGVPAACPLYSDFDME